MKKFVLHTITKSDFFSEQNSTPVLLREENPRCFSELVGINHKFLLSWNSDTITPELYQLLKSDGLIVGVDLSCAVINTSNNEIAFKIGLNSNFSYCIIFEEVFLIVTEFDLIVVSVNHYEILFLESFPSLTTDVQIKDNQLVVQFEDEPNLCFKWHWGAPL